ncbi:MAG: 50S ribosomal protein L17 [Phycisphaerae bacterium]|nr:50S ribosomal protein L17 [Phycisphaerae bacterium]
MRHRVAGKQLSRTTSHRKALRRNMAASLFQYGAIRTTEAKAKELRPFVEKLITIARQGTLHARRQVIKLLQDREMFSFDETKKNYEPEDKTVVQKLFDEIAPRYVDRPGGYTRIIRLADRRIGDAGVQVMLQLIEETAEADEGNVSGRRKKRAAKRRAAAEEATKGEEKPETTEEAEEASEEVAEAPAEETTEATAEATEETSEESTDEEKSE